MLNKTQIRYNLKSMAKRMLKGSWGLAVLVLLIPSVVQLSFTLLLYAAATLFGFDPTVISWHPLTAASAAQLVAYLRLSSLTMLMELFLIVPIGFGVVAWFIALGDGSREPFSYVFCWLDSLRRFGKSLLMVLLLLLRMLGWIIFAVMPFIAVSGYLLTFLWDGLIYSVLTFIPNFYDNPAFGFNLLRNALPQVIFLVVALVSLLLSALLLMYLIGMRYLPAFYLLNRYPEKSCNELIEQGIQMMKGHLWEALWFLCSFLGWKILASLIFWLIAYPLQLQPGAFTSIFTTIVLPLPAFLVSAYFLMSTVLFCEYVEDAARLNDGHPPYSVHRDEISFAPDFINPDPYQAPDPNAPQETPRPWDSFEP